MGAIRSPLGALGALMVLLQGISASALFALKDQPTLQLILVIMMASVTAVVALAVVVLIGWLAYRNPGLLFSPPDIDPIAHLSLYGREESPTGPAALGNVTLVVESEPDDQEQGEPLN